MYTLSDGIVIHKSDKARTGYVGSTYSPAWTLNEEKPFIGFTTNPTEPSLARMLRAPQSNSLHLGHFEDSREAAYAVAYYNENKADVLAVMSGKEQFDFPFPADLYTLPVHVTRSSAVENIKAKQQEKKSAAPAETGFASRRPKTNKARRFKADGPADLALDKYGPAIFMNLAKTYGAAEVIKARKKLTLAEFEARFGLTELV